jgi:hypothetical protein
MEADAVVSAPAAILDIDGRLVDSDYRRIVLASSAKRDEVEHYLDLLDALAVFHSIGDLRRRLSQTPLG